MLVAAALVGCSQSPDETTLKIDGMESLAESLRNQAMIEMQPTVLELGETHIIHVPTGKSSGGRFTVQHKFYEFNDGTLTPIVVADGSSGE